MAAVSTLKTAIANGFMTGLSDRGSPDRFPPRARPAAWMGRRMLVVCAIALIAARAAAADEPAPVANNGSTARQNTPADVFVRVGLLRAELELIRQKLGKPEDTRPALRVRNAAPREVYFQASTLYRKSDQLCFEHARTRIPPPELPPHELGPPDVYRVVDLALERLQQVKQRLGITQQSQAPERDDRNTPTRVFQSIVQANRQLNLLLEKQFSPDDVFQQVTACVGYGARLLGRFPKVRRIPPAPEYESNRIPADVYARLLRCQRALREIATPLNIEMVEVNEELGDPESIQPSDVYDIASMLLSGFVQVHERLGIKRQPLRAYPVDRKTPSDVYQRAGILEAQLDELIRLKATPTGLAAKGGVR